MTIMD